MRNKLGQFIKGYHYNPSTEFKKGQHWRSHQLFWDKQWLENEYIKKQRSSSEIAKEFNVTDTAILFWLKKYSIKTRSISETRKVKYWGQRNEINSQWKGNSVGYQALHTWIRRHLKRKKICQRCGIKGKWYQVKKGKRWSLDWANKSGEYKRDKNDWLQLCKKCHKQYDKR